MTPPSQKQAALRGRAAAAENLRRILVVDDNEDAADTLSDLLRILGFDVQTAYDGNAAIDALQSFSPHVVLLDLGMPDMDGYEVARRMREDRGLGLLLIAITGWGHMDDFRQTMAAGFNHHLVKPIDLKSLERILSPLCSAEPTSA